MKRTSEGVEVHTGFLCVNDEEAAAFSFLPARVHLLGISPPQTLPRAGSTVGG